MILKYRRFACLLPLIQKAGAICLLLLAVSFNGFTQFRVKFLVIDSSGKHLPDSLFVAGDFNDWDPGKNGNRFDTTNKQALVEVTGVLPGTCRYKITRGNWRLVESGNNGNDVPNRLVNIQSDTTIIVYVKAWKDDFKPMKKKHTASPNVRIIDTAFFIPQLDRTRRIWVYLPPGYARSTRRYPVMYMHDGQNIFDEYTSGFGEWGVDEIADSLVKRGKPACIIVGIDNGPRRFNEYNPYNNKNFGEGEGDQYIDFLISTLKPYIDHHYRTLSTNENTIIAGSSMGGLISFYAMLKYPQVFGKGGIFSPAFWASEGIRELAADSGKNIRGTLFFYMGEKEGGSYLADMQEVIEILGANSGALIYSIIDPESGHNEKAWRKWFPEFYNWVLAKGFNNIIQPDRP